MRYSFIFAASVALILSNGKNTYAQATKTAIPSAEEVKLREGSYVKSDIIIVEKAGLLKMETNTLELQPLLQTEGIYNPEPVPQPSPENIVPVKNIQEDDAGALFKTNDVVAPIVSGTYLASTDSRYTPPDNNVAVSNNGIVISVMNSNLRVFNVESKFLYFRNFSDLLATDFPELSTGTLYDPRVIYDSGEDRFIITLLHGNTPTTSKVLVLFSQTNNPLDGWHIYALNGNVLNNNNWMDYPTIGISNNEVYITGNLFTSDNKFSQAVILQINKKDGLAGKSTLAYQYWSNIKDASDNNAFTIYPVSYGLNGNYGPGIYFVSTTNGGSDVITMYDLTDDMTATDEKLNIYTVNNPFTYQRPELSMQKGSIEKLNPQNNRVHGAFFLDNTIHFVYAARVNNNNGIIYSRINVQNRQIQYKALGKVGTDYAFPAIASIAKDYNEKAVMIAFLASGATIFPEVRAVHVDADMNFSPSIEIQKGLSFVDALKDDVERWGDYTGIARKYNSNFCVIAGSYTNTNKRWFTKVANVSLDMQLSAKNNASQAAEVEVFPNPVVDYFTTSFNLPEMAFLDIRLYDASGKLVRTLFSTYEKPGSKKFSFNRNALPAGVYLLKATKNGEPLFNNKIVITQ